jgi:hypothetical protein
VVWWAAERDQGPVRAWQPMMQVAAQIDEAPAVAVEDAVTRVLDAAKISTEGQLLDALTTARRKPVEYGLRRPIRAGHPSEISALAGAVRSRALLPRPRRGH